MFSFPLKFASPFTLEAVRRALDVRGLEVEFEAVDGNDPMMMGRLVADNTQIMLELDKGVITGGWVWNAAGSQTNAVEVLSEILDELEAGAV